MINDRKRISRTCVTYWNYINIRTNACTMLIAIGSSNIYRFMHAYVRIRAFQLNHTYLTIINPNGLIRNVSVQRTTTMMSHIADRGILRGTQRVYRFMNIEWGRARDYRGKSFRFRNKLRSEKERRKRPRKRRKKGRDLFGKTVDWLPIVNE